MAATGADQAPPDTERAEDLAPPEPTPEHIEIVVTDEAPAEPVVDTPNEDTEIAVDDVAVSVDSAEDLPEATSSPHEDGSITDERKPEAVRRSFYSRRSAKLPRISAPKADAMPWPCVAGLRANVTTSETEDDTDPEKSPAFEAV